MRRQRRLDPFSPFLIVQIKGPQLEDFINICIARGLRLWDTVRLSQGLLVVSMDPITFRRVRILARSRWEIRIVEKRGVGFTLKRLLRRRVFLIGSIAAMVVWYVLSSYVWFVAIEGAERVETADVLNMARQAGLARGVSKSAVDLERVQRKLLLGLDDLVWAGVEIRGTQATIRVAERRIPDEIAQGPGHIVAVRDGVIERISVMQGTAVVHPGDTVRKGQILVSGLLEPGSPEFVEKMSMGEVPYTRAGGSVRATVWHEASTEVTIKDGNIVAAAQQAAEIAATLARSLLADAKAEPNGEPVIDIETDSVEGVVRVHVLLQAVQDIGVFQAVLP